jgi:protein-disulfide isomerase
MSRKHGWLLVLLVVALLIAACGPEMATPTARVASDTESSPTAAPAGETAEPEPSASETEDVKPPASGELPVAADDWRVLGSPDAPITIIEYSDFQ